MVANPEPPWFQFELRTLLIGVLLSAIVAWLATTVFHNPYDTFVVALLALLFLAIDSREFVEFFAIYFLAVTAFRKADPPVGPA